MSQVVQIPSCTAGGVHIRLMADIDAAFEQEIFDLSQQLGVTDIQHHRAADYHRRTVEITEGIVHRWRLRGLTSPLKPICSDNSVSSSFLMSVAISTSRSAEKTSRPSAMTHEPEPDGRYRERSCRPRGACQFRRLPGEADRFRNAAGGVCKNHYGPQLSGRSGRTCGLSGRNWSNAVMRPRRRSRATACGALQMPERTVPEAWCGP